MPASKLDGVKAGDERCPSCGIRYGYDLASCAALTAQFERGRRDFYSPAGTVFIHPSERERLAGFQAEAANPTATSGMPLQRAAPCGMPVVDERGTCRKALPVGCNTEFQGEPSACALTHAHGVQEGS